jgi:hypothetical protein
MTDNELAAQIDALTQLSKTRQERAAVLRAELAQIEGEIRRIESAIGDLQGVDQAALRSARSLWGQAKRRGKSPEEIKQRRLAYEVLKAKAYEALKAKQ